jgi:hypothetical protein
MRLATCLALALGGCATVAAPQHPAGWFVRCHQDTYLPRTCHAVHAGGGTVSVRYVGADGPYIVVGMHNDPVTKAPVRVDDRPPVHLTNFNQYLPAPTRAAWKAESQRVVAEMLAGRVVRARGFTLPSGVTDHEVPLEGFGEAHAKLLREAR